MISEKHTDRSVISTQTDEKKISDTREVMSVIFVKRKHKVGMNFIRRWIYDGNYQLPGMW